MPADRIAIQRALQQFNFADLFIDELLWDVHRETLPVQVDGQTYTLRAVAEKHGLVVYVCETAGGVPEHRTRRAIEAEATKAHQEHLIVFIDAERTQQVWQWVKRGHGLSTFYREQ